MNIDNHTSMEDLTFSFWRSKLFQYESFTNFRNNLRYKT